MSVSTAPTSSAPACAVPDALARAHFRHSVRIYWEDTDAGGIVFYGNYLKFMERARTEWLSSLGFGQEAMRQSGEGMFIVADTQLRYLKPARLDDRLTVTVSVCEVGRASIVFEQSVWRDHTLLTQGRVRIGWVQGRPAQAGTDTDLELRPGRIPSRILAVLPSPLSPAEVDPR
jgi:acyl-CoA thioester hydrolase